jgi:hypothetical protein
MVVASGASIPKVAVRVRRKVAQCSAELTAVGSVVNILMVVTRVLRIHQCSAELTAVASDVNTLMVATRVP